MTVSKRKPTAAELASGAYTSLLSANGLSPRQGQKDMMNFCFQLINSIPAQKTDTPHVGVVEAGTGTGKTLGYCIPLIPLAKERSKTLIISTATVALQEQIILKDIPDIQTKSGLNFTYALAKGRGRYFCPMRCEVEISAQEEAYDYVKKEVSELYEDYASGEWNGEREGFPDVIPDKVWGKVNAVASQCAKANCPHYKNCPFFQARSRLEDVDVIVANHDIVLSSLTLDGGSVLPVPEESVYVFDEGHHLTDKAINHFAADVSLDATHRWMKEVPDMVASLPQFFGAKMKEHVERLSRLSLDGMNELKTLRGHLIASFDFRKEMPDSEIYRFPEGDVQASISELFKPFRHGLNEMVTVIGKMTVLVDEAGGRVSGDNAALSKMTVGAVSSRLGIVLEAVVRFIHRPAKEPEVPVARWLRVKHVKNKAELSIHSSPVHAGEHLQKHLWTQAFGAVVTSATIRTLGKFDTYLGQAGLAADTPTMLAKSPFDYEKNGVLFVPRMRSTPKNEDEHTAEISKILPKLMLRKKGCLVLFSSKKQMTAVHDAMPEDVKKHVLMQGSVTKAEIVARHKLHIDRGEHSIIFGMDSFSEGVDLPGAYCDNVIISKLPFRVPTDPVSQTLAEWMARHNRNTFMEISVPEACIKLIQAVGRLIRTESDTGAVTILDTRIKNCRYGQDILNALPPFRREIR